MSIFYVAMYYNCLTLYTFLFQQQRILPQPTKFKRSEESGKCQVTTH